MSDLRSNLSLYYDFYIVAKEMSFSKAAKEYHVSQSGLSRSIQLLEDTLNLKLFNRSNKGIDLTLDGQQLFKKISKDFENLENSNNNYSINSKDLVGELTIGTTRNIFDNKIPMYLTKFYQKYPKVKINILTDSASNLNDFLLNHKIDVLIDYLPQINNNKKYDIEVKSLETFETAFACSQNFYKEFGNKITSIKDLEKYSLVIPGQSRRRQMLDEKIQLQDISCNIVAEMPDSKGMAEFIKENDCIGYFIKEEIESYNLVELKLKEEMPKNNIGIIYQTNISNIAKQFVQLVLEEK